jgi:hypothetical protein
MKRRRGLLKSAEACLVTRVKLKPVVIPDEQWTEVRMYGCDEKQGLSR